MNVPKDIVSLIVLTLCPTAIATAAILVSTTASDLREIEAEFGNDAARAISNLGFPLDVYCQYYALGFAFPVVSCLFGFNLLRQVEIQPSSLAFFVFISALPVVLWWIFAVQVVHVGAMRAFHWL